MKVDRSSSLLLLSVTLFACSSGSAPEPATGSTQVLPVRVAELRQQAPVHELRLPGQLRAVERVQPAFLHAGHLAERLVVRGETVRTGATLAVLHNPALAPAVATGQARVRELDTRLQQAERALARIADLHRRGMAADDDLDRAHAQRDATNAARQQAESELDHARRQLADATLRATIDGVVAEVFAELGDFVAAGQPVMVLHGQGALEVSVALPERAAQHVKPGDPVEIVAWQDGARARGRLREIGQPHDRATAPAIIEMESLPVESWLPGQAVHVHLAWREPESLLVPLTAVSDPGTGQARVFRIRDGRAEAIAVSTHRLHGGWVVVEGDLEPGDLVATAGLARLLDGAKVRILP